MMPGPRHADEQDSDVLIIGGGISGLGAAWRLRQAAPHLTVTVLEASEACGGKLVTEHVDGYTIEHGPDIFLARKPWALDLCCELGLEDELMPTNPAYKGSFVQRGGRLYPLPQGMSGLVPSRLWPLLSTRLLSPAGKLRLAMEWLVPRRRGGADEPLGRFIRRRLGREMHERLLGPLLGGIYGGDVDKLSLRATFPQFHELEADHGSLLRGVKAASRRSAAHAEPTGRWANSAFVTLRSGMQTLPEALVAGLTRGQNPARIITNCRVESVRLEPTAQTSGFYRVKASGRFFGAPHVIVTVPAYAAADMLDGVAEEAGNDEIAKDEIAKDGIAKELRGIAYNSAVMVTVGLRRKDIPHPLNGYGYLVPEVEGKAVRACTWSSSKITGRAPADRVLLRFFFGRHAEDPLLRAGEKELLSHVACELVDILGVAPGAAARPELVRVSRWLRSQPAYTMGHLERLGRLEGLVERLPGLVLTGSAYRGVGIPDVIRQAGEAADNVIGALQNMRQDTEQNTEQDTEQNTEKTIEQIQKT